MWRLRYEKDGLARIEELESSKLKLQVPKITLKNLCLFDGCHPLSLEGSWETQRATAASRCQVTNLKLT